MHLFRKCISLLLLLCIFFPGGAQQLGNFDVRRGVSPYFLGSIRTPGDSSIQLGEGGKLEYKGRIEYSYSYPAVARNPYSLGGVYFKVVVLTYVSDTLVRIMLSSIYTPRLYQDYDEKAKQEFRQLCTFLEEQWKGPGKNKRFIETPDKRIISKGLQWNTDSATMKVALYKNKSKTNPLYDISITLERPGYE